MATALQCPSCGTKKRLDGLATDTFRCENCGQVLKVPPAARRPSDSSPSPRRTGAATPPRRRAATPDAASPPPQPPPRSAAAPPIAPAPPVVAPPPSPAPGATVLFPAGGSPNEVPAVPPRGAGKPSRDALPLAVRVGAWLLAVPVGLAIIGIPARSFGYLTSQKLLDVIVKHTLTRFVPLLVIVVLWALATTILVEVFIEGGRWLMVRRRSAGSGGPDAYDDIPRSARRRGPRSRLPAGASRRA